MCLKVALPVDVACLYHRNNFPPCLLFIGGSNQHKSSSLLLSDAQNNTGSDWALKFLGQASAKQPGIT